LGLFGRHGVHWSFDDLCAKKRADTLRAGQ
jgi:hypothetical protein